MLEFIKNYNFENIKNKLILIYVLNVTDIIFTLILLNTGYYKEANALMIVALRNPINGFALKTILPAILLFYLYIRMKSARDWQLKKSNTILNIANLVYVLINVFHLVCFAILPLFLLS